jgi:polyisoprenoid-binding protein YceI
MNRRTARLAAVAIAALAVAAQVSAQASSRTTTKPASAVEDAAAQATAAEGSTHWVVDLVHSQVEFGIRHLLGRVRGSFTRWYGVIATTSDDWTHGTVSVTVQTASINTGNSYRDADLRSARFLNTDSFPTMTFKSTGITARDSTIRIDGILTLKGRSHPVVLNGHFNGVGHDLEGKQRIAFDATTKLDRRDYGISYNQMVEGTKVVGDDVEITIALEAVRAN